MTQHGAVAHVAEVARTAGEDRYFTSFVPAFAHDVASWVRTELELRFLAPGTLPPLTAKKVIDWGRERENRLLYWSTPDTRPIGYAELNHMPERNNQMWIGHFVLSPAARGRSDGRRFARALLARAFRHYGATEVLLVVFPENVQAIRCYQSAGMVVLGREQNYFPATAKTHTFVRMGITIRAFQQVASNDREGMEMPLAMRPVPSRDTERIEPAPRNFE